LTVDKINLNVDYPVLRHDTLQLLNGCSITRRHMLHDHYVDTTWEAKVWQIHTFPLTSKSYIYIYIYIYIFIYIYIKERTKEKEKITEKKRTISNLVHLLLIRTGIFLKSFHIHKCMLLYITINHTRQATCKHFPGELCRLIRPLKENV